MLSRTDLVDTLVDTVGDFVLETDVRSATSINLGWSWTATYIVLVAVALLEACMLASWNTERVTVALKLTSLVSGHVNTCNRS